MKKLLDKRRGERKKPLAGFTLIEIMVVVMIIGMLMAIVGTRIIDQYKKAQRKTTVVQIKALEQALTSYYMDNKTYPTTEQGLQALVQKPTSSPVPKSYAQNGYLDSSTVPKDQWSNDYIYFSPGQNGQPFTIESYGADGLQGGEGDNADIQSWNLGEQ